jgi:tetratricopeptide (TPR) repeat protein
MRNRPTLILLVFLLFVAVCPALSSGAPDAAFDHFRSTLHARIAEQKLDIEKNPEDPQAHFQLGLSYMALGRHHEEIAAYEEAIRLKPDFADAHYNLGAAWDLLGEGKKAVRHTQQALFWYNAHRNHRGSRTALRELRRLKMKYRLAGPEARDLKEE